jgi:hypothetical protein
MKLLNTETVGGVPFAKEEQRRGRPAIQDRSQRSEVSGQRLKPRTYHLTPDL